MVNRNATSTSQPSESGDFNHKGLLSKIPWLRLSRGSFVIAVISSIVHAHILLLNIAWWAVLLLVTQYTRMVYGYVSDQSQDVTGGLFIFVELYEYIMLVMNKQPVLRWLLRFVSFLPIYFQLIHYYGEKLFFFVPLVFLCAPFIFVSSIAPVFYGVTNFTRLLQVAILVLTVVANFFYSRELFLFLTKLLPHDSRILERKSLKEAADFITLENTFLSGFLVTLTIISDFYFSSGPHLAMQISSLVFMVTCGVLGCVIMTAHHPLSTDLIYWREWLKVLVTICVSLNLVDWVFNVKLKVLSAVDLTLILSVVLLMVFILIDFKVVLSAVTLIFILLLSVLCTHNFISSSLTEVQLSTAVHGILCEFSVIGTLLYLIHTRTL